MKILTPGSDMMQKCADYRLAKGLIKIVMKKKRQNKNVSAHGIESSKN